MPPHSSAEELARKIRRSVVEMCHLGKSSHVGAALSMTDIVAVLYKDILHVDPANPDMPDRDRFILSKGHAGAFWAISPDTVSTINPGL